jgi:hypothetical protein
MRIEALCPEVPLDRTRAIKPRNELVADEVFRFRHIQGRRLVFEPRGIWTQKARASAANAVLFALLTGVNVTTLDQSLGSARANGHVRFPKCLDLAGHQDKDVG